MTVSSALLFTGLPGATAAPDPTEATAQLIADVAPDQGEVLVGEQSGDATSASAASVDVTVPNDPEAPLTLSSVKDEHPIEIGLPAELNLAAPEAASDGTLVYDAKDGGAGAAVQILDDGSTRLQTIIPDADAQREFTYTFGEGIRPIDNGDGTIALAKDLDGALLTVGQIDKAWAIDATGVEVPTEYTISGNALVQTVEINDQTTFPVVADPRISRTWWNVTVHFTRNETAILAGGAGGVAIIAAYIPEPAISKAVAALAGLGSVYIGTIHATNRCVKAVWYIGAAGITWQPYGGSEAGGYCR